MAAQTTAKAVIRPLIGNIVGGATAPSLGKMPTTSGAALDLLLYLGLFLQLLRRASCMVLGVAAGQLGLLMMVSPGAAFSTSSCADAGSGRGMGRS